jgi:hypothetical protein
MSDTIGNVDLDDTLQVLAVPYRRWLLYLLMDRTATTIDEVVPLLCTLDNTVNDETVTETQVTIRLNQIDLPKLVDAGFIDYDRRNDDIVLVTESDELRDLLATIKKWEDPPVQTELP